MSILGVSLVSRLRNEVECNPSNLSASNPEPAPGVVPKIWVIYDFVNSSLVTKSFLCSPSNLSASIPEPSPETATTLCLNVSEFHQSLGTAFDDTFVNSCNFSGSPITLLIPKVSNFSLFFLIKLTISCNSSKLTSSEVKISLILSINFFNSNPCFADKGLNLLSVVKLSTTSECKTASSCSLSNSSLLANHL